MHNTRPFCLCMLDKALLVLSIQELMHDVVIISYFLSQHFMEQVSDA
jgi:hypothetical protein